MTSGDVANAPGPESGVLLDGTYAWPGDGDLEAFIPGLNAGDTNNASIIEFEFVPVSNSMSFDFIFAAEEIWDVPMYIYRCFCVLTYRFSWEYNKLSYCSGNRRSNFCSYGKR